jgi:hypothetical protein
MKPLQRLASSGRARHDEGSFHSGAAMARDRVYAVLLHEEAEKLIGEVLKKYLKQGPSGSYLQVRELDNTGPLLALTLEAQHNGDGDLSLDIQIPFAFVKMIATASKERDLGFLAGTHSNGTEAHGA